MKTEIKPGNTYYLNTYLTCFFDFCFDILSYGKIFIDNKSSNL